MRWFLGVSAPLRHGSAPGRPLGHILELLSNFNVVVVVVANKEGTWKQFGITRFQSRFIYR